MTLLRQHLLFGALCVIAPSAMILFGLMYLSHETFAVTCCVIGLLATAIVFFWSLFSFRRYRLRAVVGIIVCLLVFWLLLTIPGYVEAKRQRLAVRPSEQSSTEMLLPVVAQKLSRDRPLGAGQLQVSH